jgi:hypothetical protein
MNVKALREILDQAEEFYRAAGNERAATALREFSGSIAPYDTKTVDAFVKLAAKANSPGA